MRTCQEAETSEDELDFSKLIVLCCGCAIESGGRDAVAKVAGRSEL